MVLKKLKELAKILEGVMELKTDWVYEKGYNSNYYIIYIIKSKAVEVEKVLKKFYFERKSHIKYVTFKGTESQDRICYLHANEFRNVKRRFEILYNININQMISIKEGLVKLKDYLVDVKIGKAALFIEVEQGAGKYESNILVIYIPRMKIKYINGSMHFTWMNWWKERIKQYMLHHLPQLKKMNILRVFKNL